MLPEKVFKQVLKKLDIPSKALSGYKKAAEKARKPLETYMLEKDLLDETKLYKAAADHFKVELAELRGKEISKEVLEMIPAPLAQTHNVIAFAKSKDAVKIAMIDPTDIQTIEFIHRKTGLTPHVFMASPADIKEAMRRYHADLESDITISSITDQQEQEDDLKKAAEELPIINIVNSILEHAVYEGASDIHIEPTDKQVSVRYRVDGVLRGVMTLPKKVKNGITARLKILANLKIDEHMVPQDGRFKIKVQEEQLAFRVSIIPVYDGEKIVMRLLHEGQKPLSLDQLGFQPRARAKLEAAIAKPHGMVLVTGPTGSGKTTTLYSVLGILNKPEVNISTIEDPIEYHVGGINQSQVNHRVGFDFAAGLRAFLRQDPDIIMVGEIRDQETAEIAIHAAMTGHLVLSTLHTNDAPTTLPRLLDMDIPPFLVAFTANVIVAQRLVRRICDHCKEEFKLEEGAVKELSKAFDTEQIATFFKQHNITLKATEKNFHSIIFYRGKGCARCGHSGYKGRVGIYEVMEIDDEMVQKINERATASEIGQLAREKGMITMLQDGLIKSKKGFTTIEEVLRVTRD